MGILTDQNLLPLKKFLDERLPKLTQVDKENLKRFILALLTKKESREQIKSSCVKELKVFCEKDTHIDFVDSLFDKIDELDGKKVTTLKPLDSESKNQKERRKSSSSSRRSTEKSEKEPKQEKDSSDKGKRDSKKTNGEYKSSLKVTTCTDESGGRTVSGEGGRRSKRRSRDRSRDRESSRKRRRRDKSQSSRSPSPDPIITEKELRRLIKDNADEDDYRQILNNPKLLQSYVDAINSESFEFLGGGLTKDWKSKVDDHILPLPPFGLEPAPNPPAVIADDIRAQVRLDSRRLPPTRDPFYQPPDDYLNPIPSELPRQPPLHTRNTHIQRKPPIRKSQPDRRNLFIRNIPVEKNKIATLNEFFSKFGSIENLQVHADRNKAFVQFSSPAEAEKCVEECQKTVVMDDTRISVHWAYYNRPDFNRNAFSKDVPRGLGRGRGRGRVRASSGFGRGRGRDDSIKFNHGPIPQIFADEYVNMDRPTNGLYSKTPSQIGPRKVKPKRATLAFLDKSKIDKIEYSGESKEDVTNKEPKKEPKEEPNEEQKKSTTSSDEKTIKEVKPAATAATRKTPSEEQLSLTKVVDKQIDVCKTQRDKQMEMWEKLVKMKAKSKDKKEFQSELSKSIKELHEKLSKLMEKKKQLILLASTRARLPWRGSWRGYRGRGRGRGRGIYRGRGRGRARGRGAFHGSLNLVVDNRSPTLKIDELPEAVNEFDLMTHFSKFGKVSSIDLSDGGAKIDFMTRQDAELALLKGRVFDGLIDGKITLKMSFL